MSFEVKDILSQRNKTHGNYGTHAKVKEEMITSLSSLPNWDSTSPTARQGATMVVDKLCRAFNGDPSFEDHWVDIQGYAKLVQDWTETCVSPPIKNNPFVHTESVYENKHRMMNRYRARGVYDIPTGCERTCATCNNEYCNNSLEDIYDCCDLWANRCEEYCGVCKYNKGTTCNRSNSRVETAKSIGCNDFEKAETKCYDCVNFDRSNTLCNGTCKISGVFLDGAIPTDCLRFDTRAIQKKVTIPVPITACGNLDLSSSDVLYTKCNRCADFINGVCKAKNLDVVHSCSHFKGSCCICKHFRYTGDDFCNGRCDVFDQPFCGITDSCRKFEQCPETARVNECSVCGYRSELNIKGVLNCEYHNKPEVANEV